jgi:hypothetical protein
MEDQHNTALNENNTCDQYQRNGNAHNTDVKIILEPGYKEMTHTLHSEKHLITPHILLHF